MRQTSLRYAVVPVALGYGTLTAAFGPQLLVHPSTLAVLASVAGFVLAGSVAAVEIGPLTLSWRGVWAASVAGFGLSALPQAFAGDTTVVERLLAGLLAVTMVAVAVVILRRPSELTVTENVQRVVRLGA